jgi:hypothetical protein
MAPDLSSSAAGGNPDDPQSTVSISALPMQAPQGVLNCRRMEPRSRAQRRSDPSRLCEMRR